MFDILNLLFNKAEYDYGAFWVVESFAYWQTSDSLLSLALTV